MKIPEPAKNNQIPSNSNKIKALTVIGILNLIEVLITFCIALTEELKEAYKMTYINITVAIVLTVLFFILLIITKAQIFKQHRKEIVLFILSISISLFIDFCYLRSNFGYPH